MTLIRIGTVVAAALFLAGCGSESAPDSTAPSKSSSSTTSAIAEPAAGLPDGVEGNRAGTAGAGLSDDGQLWVTTYGSSTNPLVVAEVSTEAQTVTVTFEQPPGPATMDLVPSTTTMALPDGVDPDEPVSVVLGDAGTVNLDPASPGTIVWVPAG